jgi:hypothetical protein
MSSNSVTSATASSPPGLTSRIAVPGLRASTGRPQKGPWAGAVSAAATGRFEEFGDLGDGIRCRGGRSASRQRDAGLAEMRRGGMPWVKAWTKATRFLASMRSHRSPIIRGHRHAGPSPTRPPAAAQIRVICARSAVREAYPQEASKFAKVVKTTRDGRQLTRRYFAFGDTDPSEGPTTGGAACSGAHPQGCPPGLCGAAPSVCCSSRAGRPACT